MLCLPCAVPCLGHKQPVVKLFDSPPDLCLLPSLPVDALCVAATNRTADADSVQLCWGVGGRARPQGLLCVLLLLGPGC